MKKILFINLKRFGDIFSMEQIIQSLKADSPHYEIGVVVYKEFESAARCLAGVTKVYTIDRKRISMLCKNKYFPKTKLLTKLQIRFPPSTQTTGIPFSIIQMIKYLHYLQAFYRLIEARNLSAQGIKMDQILITQMIGH